MHKTFDGFTTVNQRTVEEHLNFLATIIPDWLFELTVFGPGHASDDYLSSVTVRINYRSATLYVAAAFFNESYVSQRRILLHEICHLHTSPIMEQFRLHHPIGSIENTMATQWLEFTTCSMVKTFEGLLK
jgi:hypothetical protein